MIGDDAGGAWIILLIDGLFWRLMDNSGYLTSLLVIFYILSVELLARPDMI